ncbi:MAG TPA: putative metal-binding motif-containing protein [Kofleriaceae bacterium]|nr:putative metal-binding motif-containing protein [Kofleriaceae bacterium]
MKKRLFVVVLAAAAACSSSSPPKQLFQPKPECMGDAVVPYMGTDQSVINTLAIGSLEDGFDLDGDGKPDNKLSAVSSLAQSSIDDAFKSYEIVIPMEWFNFPAVAATACVKFAFYLASFDTDGDGDGKRPGIAGGDCNDTGSDGAAIHPGATEIPGNLIDDDCNGLADDTNGVANTTETTDMDGDGQSVADGDCDDTDPTIYKGAPEICGDGKDNDCDGVADRSTDAMGNVTACDPFDPTQMMSLALDPLSFDSSGAPVIAFTNGSIDSTLALSAGPSVFSVNIPISNGITLDLEITGAQIAAQVQPDGTIMGGRLGGIISAKTMDTITGLNVSEIGLTPMDSLLDATYGNLLGPLLALPKAKASILKKYPECRTPDIDVDGDGLEAFCSSNPDATNKVADVCIDGDGTTIMSTYDANGNILTHCAQAVDSHGKPRFVDGVSVELNFTTSRIKSILQPVQ